MFISTVLVITKPCISVPAADAPVNVIPGTLAPKGRFLSGLHPGPISVIFLLLIVNIEGV